jgi:sigma-E factor negative regulatory protein RseA
MRRRLCLSALADGEARQDEVAAACAAWRDDAQTRADWHTYALIGDVLRSEDLACGATADTAFLARLRERMAHEPVVLAPVEAAPPQMPAVAPAVAVAGGGRHWGAPMAMAAGVLTVIGVAAVMRGVAVPEAPVTLAAAPVPNSAVALADAGAVRQVGTLMAEGLTAEPSELAASAFVRDPALDRYLDAHRKYGRGMVLATPGGVRQVAASPAGR